MRENRGNKVLYLIQKDYNMALYVLPVTRPDSVLLSTVNFVPAILIKLDSHAK